MDPRLRVIAPVLALTLLGGCGAATTATTASPDVTASPSASDPSGDETADVPGKKPRPSPGEPTAPTPDATAEVPETLAFTATTVGGESFDGASLTGRPTLLWFWAPWCPTCRSQIPQVEGLAASHDGELNVIGVGSLDSADAIAEFAGDVPGVTHLDDSAGELFRRFEIAEQSSFVLLDADGQVAFETGYGGSDDLDQQVAAVLG